MLGGYDFAAFGRVADIGGGHGHLIHTLLDAKPAMWGILFSACLPGATVLIIEDVLDDDHPDAAATSWT